MTIPEEVLHHWKQSLSAYKICLDDSKQHENNLKYDRKSGEAGALNRNIAKRDQKKSHELNAVLEKQTMFAKSI